MPKTKSTPNLINSTVENIDWHSPITPELITQHKNTPLDLFKTNTGLIWLKSCGDEDGRVSIFTLPNDNSPSRELTPSPYNARSKVHEYGGGAVLVAADKLYFSNFTDHRLYEIDLGDAETSILPRAVTPVSNRRYADACWDKRFQRIICVCEDHSSDDAAPINSLIAIEPDTGAIKTLCSGADFYASPRISPSSDNICWLSWDHPYMPWDSTKLWQADIDIKGNLSQPIHIAGGKEESIVQPRWSSANVLHFISDRSGWWNIYRYQDGQSEILYKTKAEFSKPMWSLGLKSYDFTSNGEILSTYVKDGQWFIGLISRDIKFKSVLGPFSNIMNLLLIKDKLYFIKGNTAKNNEIVAYDLSSGKSKTLVSEQNANELNGYLSTPQTLKFKTKDNTEISGYFYSPSNKDYQLLENNNKQAGTSAPPLIIKTHGGPSSSANSSLDLSIQFWTSRGFAVFDINYRGSTGYGRNFRQQLYGKWGISDIEDCTAAAESLVSRGLANPEQLIIRGQSAGGYTTLAALTFTDTFKAGASYYGISDLKALAMECHKFESHYVQQLLGQKDLNHPVYAERSPLAHKNKLSCPIIFFQGKLDKVVPPNQAQNLVNELKKQGINVEYIEFEHEAHGFRQSTSIKTTLYRELAFYQSIFKRKLIDFLE